MKSNGGVLSAAEVAHQPISTVLSGPAAGALGAALVTRTAGFDRVLTLDGGGTSTDVSVVLDGEPALTTEGSVGGYPSKIPMVDVVTVGAGGGSVAWLSREGGLKVGPRSAGADPGPMCYGRGGTEPTVTDANLVLGGSRPTCSAARCRSTRPPPGPAWRPWGPSSGSTWPPWPPGCWRSRPGTRPTPCARSPSSAASTCATSSWPPSAGRGRWPCAGCSRCSACPRPSSPRPRQPVRLRPAHRRRQERRGADRGRPPRRPRPGGGRRHPGRPGGAGRRVPGRRGLRPPTHRYLRSADLRYYGQAFEVRVPFPDGPVDPASTEATVAAFHDAHHRLYGYSFRDDPTQQVEWVNLRVTGIGPIRRPTLQPHPPTGARRSPAPTPPRPPPGPRASTPIMDLSTQRSIAVTTWPRVTWSRARRWWRSTGPPSRSTRGSGPGSTASATWS